MRFSVLLPTRCGGKYLGDCISSILSQPYKDMELVVSNNANTDETVTVLNSFTGDSRLKVVNLAHPVPVTDNWNSALSASRGDYVLMMGDDDCLLPGYFQRMDEILGRHNDPDCVTYNAYSYMAPNSVGQDKSSYYNDPFFNFGSKFKREGEISRKLRFLIAKDMFRFYNRIPLNMQTTLMSRNAMNKIKGGAFQPPFPDHYALNSLLLTTKSWVFSPEKLLVVGVSPKSFGHFTYSNKQEEGRKYLGINPEFEGRLPGIELNNCMHIWLSLLKANYPEELKNISISSSHYVRHQVYSWYSQYRSGALTRHDLNDYFRQLIFMDWFYLFFAIFDIRCWKRLLLMLRNRQSNQVQRLWPQAVALEDISNINEFSGWIKRKLDNLNVKD